MTDFCIVGNSGASMKHNSSMRVKRLTNTARLPERAHNSDLGYDLFVDLGDDDHEYGPVILYGESKLISTGISIAMPSGWGLFVKDRSSVSSKLGLHVHAGVIDNGYHGEIKVLLHKTSPGHIRLEHGMKIAQLVPIMMPSFDISEVYEFEEETSRGNDGFGSTGS